METLFKTLQRAEAFPLQDNL